MAEGLFLVQGKANRIAVSGSSRELCGIIITKYK